jgi:hypothetical protein
MEDEMADDKLKDFIKYTAKAAEYFGKASKGRSPLMEGMEESIVGPTPPVPPPTPPVPPPTIEPDKKLLKKSTGGSPPFSEAEMRQGYRKMK